MVYSPENPFLPIEPPPPSVERKTDRVERFLDATLLELLERRARKINEGQNGVIFRLGTEQLSEDVQARLSAAGIDLEGDNVAKILKLNYAGVGKMEYEMQKRSFELIASQSNPSAYAKIPKPKIYRNVQLTESSKEYFESYGVKTNGRRCDVIIMDEVHGDDVATALYKEAIRRHPKTVNLRDQVDEMDFLELQSAVADALEYTSPGGKSRDEQERKFEERKVFAQNSAKLFRFLAQRGFRIEPSIIEKMERTMDLFHANGLCHRDAHHRNFMVAGSIEQRKPGEPEPEVFIIDFGTMTEFEGPFTEAIFSEQLPSGEMRNYPNDIAVPKDLRTYFMPEAADIERKNVFLKNLSTIQARLSTRPVWRSLLEKFQQSPSIGTKEISALYSASPEPKLDTFFVAVQALKDQGRIDQEAIRQFFESEKRKRGPAESNKIDQFLRYII
jgi:hypothetical protein